jgi:hypothetical protein
VVENQVTTNGASVVLDNHNGWSWPTAVRCHTWRTP